MNDSLPAIWFDRENPPHDRVEAFDLYVRLGMHIKVCNPGTKVQVKITDGYYDDHTVKPALVAKREAVADNARNVNLAVEMGEPSRGLIDIDLDTSMMKRLFPLFADRFLPPGAPAFGRRGKEAGHFLYRVKRLADSGRTKMYGVTPAEAAEANIDFTPGGDDKCKVVEVRSTGGYTVMPGSTLGTDPIVFSRWGTPPEIERAELERKVLLCAAMSLIVGVYAKAVGHRNELCLALAGALCKVEWLTDADVDWIVGTVARLGGDTEPRAGRATDTRAKLEAGEPVWGLSKVCEILGFDALKGKLTLWMYGKRERVSVEPVDTSALPEIVQLNRRYILCQNYGGKCRVLEEFAEPRLGGRTVLTALTVADVRSAHMNRSVVIGSRKGVEVTEPLGDHWLKHPARRQCRRVVFDPQCLHASDELNLWTGFAVTPKPGSWRLMRRHLLGNVCSGNRQHYRYLIRWIARMVQCPWEPGYSAVVLRGEEGTGKSIVKRNLMRFFGRHALSVSQPSHLVGNFNAHLRDVVFLAAEEAFFAGDKKHASVLKMIVTEDHLPIEAKGVNVEDHPNRIHLMMLSNEDWIVPTSVNDRRFFILDVSSKHREDHAYFKAIQEEMDNGGLEAMLHDLLAMDLSRFNVRAVPKTDALRNQQRETLQGVAGWWHDVLETGDLPELRWSEAEGAFVIEAGPLLASCRDFKGCERISRNRLSAFLVKPQGGGKVRKFMGFRRDRAVAAGDRTGKGRTGPTSYFMPPLAECRRLWDHVMYPENWNEETEWNGDTPRGTDDPELSLPWPDYGEDAGEGNKP